MKKEYWILKKDGTKEKVCGEVRKTLGIHKVKYVYTHNYVITHIPTGMSVTRFEKLYRAKAYVRAVIETELFKKFDDRHVITKSDFLLFRKIDLACSVCCFDALKNLDIKKLLTSEND